MESHPAPRPLWYSRVKDEAPAIDIAGGFDFVSELTVSSARTLTCVIRTPQIRNDAQKLCSVSNQRLSLLRDIPLEPNYANQVQLVGRLAETTQNFIASEGFARWKTVYIDNFTNKITSSAPIFIPISGPLNPFELGEMQIDIDGIDPSRIITISEPL